MILNQLDDVGVVTIDTSIYEVAMFQPVISVVLGSYNRVDFLKLVIESIRNEVKNIHHEIIVVDGGSSDGALQWLLQQKDIITIVQHNRGEWQGKEIKRRSWGYFMNLAFKAAQGRYVCMVSDHCLFVPGAIKNGYDYIERLRQEGRNVGAVAFYWREWPKDTLYHVSRILEKKIFVNHGLYLRDAIKYVHYIDEDRYFFYYADVDLCLKMYEAGYEVVDAPHSYVEHYPFVNISTRKTNDHTFDQDSKSFFRRWEGIFYDRFNNDRLMRYTKKTFIDDAQVAEKFRKFHEIVIAKFPKIMKKKSFLATIKNTIYWKFRSGIKKLKCLIAGNCLSDLSNKL